LTVTNGGPDDAETVVVLDSTPALTTFVSSTAPLGWSTVAPSPGATGAIKFSKSTLLSSDGPQSFSIVVRVSFEVPIGTPIENTATVSSATSDSNLANNLAVALSTVTGFGGPAITDFEVRGDKLIVDGRGLTDHVQVFIDGIAFKKEAEVKIGAGQIVQKGK